MLDGVDVTPPYQRPINMMFQSLCVVSAHMTVEAEHRFWSEAGQTAKGGSYQPRQ